MVKKCLIAIAVVALLASTVQAATYPAIKKEGSWPWEKIYDKLDICTLDVVLEVGHFVQIYKCNELKMKLVQVNCGDVGKSGKFPCYGGIVDDVHGPACITVKARANFAAVFGATFSGSNTNIITDKALSWPEGDDIDGGGSWEDLKLCMLAWNVKLWESGATSGTVKVGTITINVKPPNEYGP